MNKMNKNDKLTVNYMRINSYDMYVQFYTNMIAETWGKYFNKNAIHLLNSDRRKHGISIR